MLNIEALSNYSSVVQRVAAQPDVWAVQQALVQAPAWDDALLMQQAHSLANGDLHNPDTLATALQRLRSAAIAALAQMDSSPHAELGTIMGNMTALAHFALRTTLMATGKALAAQYGYPIDSHGQAIDLQVVAMGKLGGAELNVSSDIDIVFLARELIGDTAGVQVHGLKRRISNSEFMHQWARRCVALLNTHTAHGFVFRVDTLLRPHGSEGALVCTHDYLDNYLVTQGRMWERLAWLKASPVLAPVFESPDAHRAGHAAWQAIVQPFVYRRYLDFTVIDALRDLHSKIRADRRQYEGAASRGVHVKLGRGGIREIEFWVQGQQLIRAGRDPSLRILATLPALQALASAKLIAPGTAYSMTVHYRFLRRAEHAAQYVADAQTHVMPADDAQRGQIAAFLNFEQLATFDEQLARCMSEVTQRFDTLFAPVNTASVATPTPIVEPANTAVQQQYAEKLNALPIPDATRMAIDVLFNQFAAEDEATYERLARFVLSISKRKTYIDLLIHHPPACERLRGLMKASAFAADYLMQHPALLDDLIDGVALNAPCDAAFWAAETDRLMQRLPSLDAEQQIHALREAHHGWLVKILSQDLTDSIGLRAVSDALSAAADCVLSVALCCVQASFGGRFELPAGLGIIAYGKLGGKELGYGSDLDIVFVYDVQLAGEAAAQYPRLVQRVMSWLSAQTTVGRLFEIDTALRPNGQAGLMLTHIDAFSDYQLNQAAGTHAWLWEHQAISRARLCAGDTRLTQAFDAIRSQVLRLPRDGVQLKREVADMRHKLRLAYPVPDGMFDVKHSLGGIIDIEFAVQYLVLKYAAEHTPLLVNSGNAALLETAGELGLIERELVKGCAQGYVALRQLQHRARLDNRAAVFATNDHAMASIVQVTQAVQALWQALGLNDKGKSA